MPRSFLLEPARSEFNLDSCEKYGEVSLLFPAGFPISLGKPKMFEKTVLERLNQVDFDCNVDYIILAGKLSRLCWLCGIIGTKYNELKTLAYNDRTGEYTPAAFIAPE